MRKFGGMMVLSALLAGLALPAWAGAQDYRFEAVQPHVAVSPQTEVAVRLVHVPTGKPVTDAIMLPARAEMPMADTDPMVGKVSGGKPDGAGAYGFTADFNMTGTWFLKLAAKVQGEADTVTGSVPFTAAHGSHNHH